LVEFEAFLSYVNVLPVSLLGAKISANICATLRVSGNLIGHNDILIAGTAIENDMKLITNNQKDFSRVPGLDFESWA
jgi:tRNA(fMet)-specific endonuclease VapC